MAKVKIELTCDSGSSKGKGMPGDVIDVDSEYAEFLVSNKAARYPDAKKRRQPETATAAPAAENAATRTEAPKPKG